MSQLPSKIKQSLYEQDFYLWLKATAKILKENRFEELDIENLIEEIESMGKSQKRELESRLIVIMEHLLKLIYWSTEKDYNQRSWRETMIEQRIQIELNLEESPSLRNLLPELFLASYYIGRRVFLKKSNLPVDIVPAEPPFTLKEVLDFDYLP